MSSIIQNKVFFPIDNWLSNKELAKTPPWKDHSADLNYFQSERVTTLWQRFIFYLYTGLDLQKIRRYRIDQYIPNNIACPPAMTQEEYLTKTLPSASERGYSFCDLETYWVDREISAHITDLGNLKEILKYHRLPFCREIDPHHDINTWGIERNYPIEWKLAVNVAFRINFPRRSPRLLLSYNEETDTFRYVSKEESCYAQSSEIDNPNRVIGNWINTSLTKRLEQDIERRKQDPNCRLFFVYNEMFEERLRKRLALVNSCWVATAALASLAGIVFFYRIIKENKCD